MVAPLVGAAARMGAKKLAEKGSKKAIDKDFLKGYVLPTSVIAGSGMGAAAVGEKSRNERDEAEQEKREAKDEMKRETRGMKNGGKVSSASKRADGCAVKGKTRGRMV